MSIPPRSKTVAFCNSLNNQQMLKQIEEDKKIKLIEGLPFTDAYEILQWVTSNEKGWEEAEKNASKQEHLRQWLMVARSPERLAQIKKCKEYLSTLKEPPTPPPTKEEKEYAEIIELIEKLQVYGWYNYFSKERVKNYNELQRYRFDIQQLKTQVKQCENAEIDAEKMLKDNDLMNRLITANLSCNKNNKALLYNSISQPALKIIQPELDRRVMERKIDEEARRRIQEQKEFEEKQKFEEAVKKRMMELSNK
jgi:hypothetical protein